MEFLDEEARPRFLFQSRNQSCSPASPPGSPTRPGKPFLCITISISAALICLSFLYIQSEPFKSLLLWAASSLLVGPFAPASLTGGDIRVGQGSIVEFPDPEPEPEPEARKKPTQRRSRSAVADDFVVAPVPEVAGGSVKIAEKDSARAKSNAGPRSIAKVEEEKGWSEDDIDILRKQLLKHPAGKPRRWEIIAEAFNGRHRAESIIKMTKELANRKTSDKDSYAQFLKNRKQIDTRMDDGFNDSTAEKVEASSDIEWSSGEDIALLNALKAFPKDVSMRWEKIASAVPGKTKAACVKRVAELKRNFRGSKAAKDKAEF